MKRLKIILLSVYVGLILLLFLLAKGCNPVMSNSNRDEIPMDTTLVEQAEKTGKSGNLKVTLLWNFQGDIDLHIQQPNGKEIYYKEPKDISTGGYLDVDNQSGGRGSAENIYWELPPKGTYHISLVYYAVSQSTGVAESGECSVVVIQEGKSPKTYKITLSTVKDVRHVTSITVN